MKRLELQMLMRACVGLVVCCAGCNTFKTKEPLPEAVQTYNQKAVDLDIEYADVYREPSPLLESLAPRRIEDGPPEKFWELTFEQVLEIALGNSKVVGDLGGRVLTAPDGAPTVFDPALIAADPSFGPEGALSAFDAQLATSMFWARNDRATNNIITGGGIREIVQDLGTFQSQLTKTAATGTQFTLQNLTQYDQSNQPGNLFISGWDTQFEINVTQPLLRGAGVKFNRIAGPNATVGLGGAPGVLLARINTDVSLADFEINVRNFVNELEDAYWDLYFAYRDLDGRLAARDSALDTWRMVSAKLKGRLQGAESYREAEAREQYYFFQDLVQDSLNGAPIGSQSVGVYRGERRLRRLMGLAANDGRMIRPADEPSRAKVTFQWEETLHEALLRRVELRRQLWQIKRRELELIASKNFVLPQLDAVAQYRWRGFGDDLTGNGGLAASAFQDLKLGAHQEWQLGFQFNYDFGYRAGHAGIQQAKLQLARDRAVLKRQELDISHELSEAIGEVDRAYNAVKVSFDRLNAAIQRRDATRVAFDADRVPLDLLLQAQQRLSDAQTRYFFSLALYARAVKNVHLSKGSLLRYCGIQLSEGAWPHKAYTHAHVLHRRTRPKLIDYRFNYLGVISQGRGKKWQAAEAGQPTAAPSEDRQPVPEVIPTPNPREENAPPRDNEIELPAPVKWQGSHDGIVRLPRVDSLPSTPTARDRNWNQFVPTPRTPESSDLPTRFAERPRQSNVQNREHYPGANVGYDEPAESTTPRKLNPTRALNLIPSK